MSQDPAVVASEIGIDADSQTYQFAMPPHTFRADVDAARCASGAPVFDESGRLVGSVAWVYRPDGTYDDQPHAWSTQVVDLAPHIETIRQLVPSNDECASSP